MHGTEPAKILLVDDQRANLFALEQVLARPGYEIVKAESGAQALAFLLRSECAVILLDVSMPDMDGYEVARLVRQNARTREIPIVFVTAMAQDERDVLDGYQSGAIDYLVKPVRPEVLRRKVAGFVELHRARQEIRHQAELLREHERVAHRHTVAALELRALQRQQAAQRRYQTLVEGLARAIAWILDPVTLVPRLVSPGAHALLGVDPDWWGAAPRAWTERIHPDDRERFVGALHALVPGGPAVRLEHRMTGAGGRTLWFETSVRLIVGEDASVEELHGLSTDVTDGVAAREGAAFLARASAELAGSLDVESTMRTAVRLAVPELAEWCVLEARTAGMGPHDAVAGHEAPGREQAAREAGALLDVARVRAFEAVGVVDARELWPGPDSARALEALGPASTLVVPLAAHGSRIGTLCLCSGARSRLDGPARARAEELGRRVAQAIENAFLHEQTRAAVLAREQFLSIASHELRTPLTALSLQSRLLEQLVLRAEDPSEVVDELRRRVHSIQRQVGRLGALTNSVLDLARIRSARLRLEVEPCDLAEIVRDVASRFEDTLRTEGRTLSIAAPVAVVGRWDRTRLEQLLSNLVVNAVKHGGRGGVTISAEPNGASAVVTVSDTGPGIPPAQQALVFDAFAQGDRGGAGGSGSGSSSRAPSRTRTAA